MVAENVVRLRINDSLVSRYLLGRMVICDSDVGVAALGFGLWRGPEARARKGPDSRWADMGSRVEGEVRGKETNWLGRRV